MEEKELKELLINKLWEIQKIVLENYPDANHISMCCIDNYCNIFSTGTNTSDEFFDFYEYKEETE
ncbi:MAG: hypothetical protein ACLRZ9_11470 [Eubacterium sp.]